MNRATEQKRAELAAYIQAEVIPETSVQGIVVIGSVAKGTARSDSDVDAVVFLEPYDLYTVPAESKWQPGTREYHGIFSDVAKLRQARLDEALTKLDWLLKDAATERTWDDLESTVAHYRLHSVFDYLIQAHSLEPKQNTWNGRNPCSNASQKWSQSVSRMGFMEKKPSMKPLSVCMMNPGGNGIWKRGTRNIKFDNYQNKYARPGQQTFGQRFN